MGFLAPSISVPTIPPVPPAAAPPTLANASTSMAGAQQRAAATAAAGGGFGATLTNQGAASGVPATQTTGRSLLG